MQELVIQGVPDCIARDAWWLDEPVPVVVRGAVRGAARGAVPVEVRSAVRPKGVSLARGLGDKLGHADRSHENPDRR